MQKAIRINSEEPKKPTRFFSNNQEKQIVSSIGGRQTSNSGATYHTKGDVLIGEGTKNSWLIEAKTCTTPKESFSIRKEWITKNRQEMVYMGKRNQAIVFNFGPNQENFYILDEDTFKELSGL